MAIADERTRYQKAIQRLEKLVSSRWPTSRFRVTELPEGEGMAVWAYCDGNFWDVSATTSDAEFEAMDKQGVFVYVIPMPSEAWED